MFWRKKNDFGTGYEYYKDGELLCSFEMDEERPEWKGEALATRKELNKLNDKLDLILKELGKEFVPESSKTEPAKLVDEKKFSDMYNTWLKPYLDSCTSSGATETKPKKKRGRPKKK